MDQKQTPDGPTPSRYKWQFQGATFDFYRLCEIIGVTSDPAKHAIKKIIRAGKSVKPIEQDITEAIDALLRWKEMLQEDAQPMNMLKIGTSISNCQLCGEFRGHGHDCDPKPEADDDGWIPWGGGECPVGPDTLVTRKFRDGLIIEEPMRPWLCRWQHYNHYDDIIAYRIATLDTPAA